MTNDRNTDRAIDDNTPKNNPTDTVVHLDIDGTMELGPYPVPHRRAPSESPPEPPAPEPNIHSTPADLRHIIRLQRIALNQQNLRIQQQRALITRLRLSINRQLDANQASRRLNWLKALLFRRKDDLETD